MAEKVFVERRPEGDYAVLGRNSRASGVAPTQGEATALAQRLNPDGPVRVERVRHTSVGKPDKWLRPAGVAQPWHGAKENQGQPATFAAATITLSR